MYDFMKLALSFAVDDALISNLVTSACPKCKASSRAVLEDCKRAILLLNHERFSLSMVPFD
jgi:hypothetical protein